MGSWFCGHDPALCRGSCVFIVCCWPRPSVATADNDSARSKAIEKIVAISPQAKAVTVTEQYVCQIHSWRHIDVRSLETGYLKAIPIREGQAVKAGELMFEIVPVLYKARWEAAVAERDLAQLELNNTKRLADETRCLSE